MCELLFLYTFIIESNIFNIQYMGFHCVPLTEIHIGFIDRRITVAVYKQQFHAMCP